MAEVAARGGVTGRDDAGQQMQSKGAREAEIRLCKMRKPEDRDRYATLKSCTAGQGRCGGRKEESDEVRSERYGGGVTGKEWVGWRRQ